QPLASAERSIGAAGGTDAESTGDAGYTSARAGSSLRARARGCRPCSDGSGVDPGDRPGQDPVRGHAPAGTVLFGADDRDGADAQGGETGGTDGQGWRSHRASRRPARQGHDGEPRPRIADEGAGSADSGSASGRGTASAAGAASSAGSRRRNSAARASCDDELGGIDSSAAKLRSARVAIS